MKVVQVPELLRLRESKEHFALLDVREAGEIHDGHIPGATALPRRMIELRVAELVAAKATRVVVYDEGGTRAELAVRTLEALGYADVSVLQGGTGAWTAAGESLAEGRNVPSKLFAERMFVDSNVPQVTAETLHDWAQGMKPHVVLDIRAPEEHVLGHVPGAHNVPGVEIALIAADLQNRKCPVVVHCAGRTRSILACQTLRELGLDQVFALKNGTMGWTLAGFELEREMAASYGNGSAEAIAEGERRARSLAHSVGVEQLSPAQFVQWLAEVREGSKDCYAIDVRQADAYAAGHIPGVKSVPGGQAVLFADDHVAVRQAPIVFVDDDETRALMTAYWFRRLGYPSVYVLAGGIKAWQRETGGALETGRGRTTPLMLDEAKKSTNQLSPSQLKELLEQRPTPRILDVNTSKNFSAGHLHGAVWLSRGWLEICAADLLGDKSAPVAVVCQNGVQSSYAGATLRAMGYISVYVLSAGLAAWKKAGLPLEKGAPAAAKGAADVVKSPYERTREDMVNYLRWEEHLAEKPGKDQGRPS